MVLVAFMSSSHLNLVVPIAQKKKLTLLNLIHLPDYASGRK